MYKMSAMFWYRIFFMTELLVAESALVYRFKTRSYFLLRMAATLVMCFAFAFAVPILAENAIWYCAMFFLLFAFTVFMLWFCFKEKFLTVINRKCHDMKHQIRKIGSTSAIEPDIVQEIESLVSVYDTNVKTGNEALDVILTEKSMICKSRGIKLCCIIDGKSIGFISPSDTYALFGNILDNAIEAVSELDSESRTVSLSVSCKNSFAVGNTHNCYEGKLSFDKMLPKTTKADTNMHGYGMKSIKHVVEKYGGEMSVKAENGVFNLNLIFPCGKLRTDSTENEIGIAKHGNMD